MGHLPEALRLEAATELAHRDHYLLLPCLHHRDNVRQEVHENGATPGLLTGSYSLLREVVEALSYDLQYAALYPKCERTKATQFRSAKPSSSCEYA